MTKRIHYGFILLMAATLLLSGCGRKEAPQMTNGSSVKPSLNELYHQVAGNVLELRFTLQGIPEGVGYQIDRTEMDPYCQCPGFWRRFDERLPQAKMVNSETTKLISLKTDKKAFLFRIRAIDATGNLGPWSKIITARGVDLSK
ncbi:hypothetical protein MMIC_P0592 [Mariprofundus micogutta]|uniref:Lipoprotein n=1 Tax=Mariprofundus micogutta TaxID=1921010 RepID=A0A1L8CL63_9PROT|nr:lipoprotein [Mariprofundus micogutta]GAV19643.1 hypothetical protein MMIC_P0592 [Mariprofundus micogutta]